MILGDYRRGLGWRMDLLTTYTHDSEVQVITAPPLISTIHKSSQHPLSIFPACCIFTSRSLATASNSGDFFSFTRWGPLFTASRAELTLNWLIPQLITSRHGPRWKPRFHCSTQIVALLRICCLATGTCLPKRSLFTESPLSNGSIRDSKFNEIYRVRYRGCNSRRSLRISAGTSGNPI
jgi:hypothetical protein